jgi:hypothetical protein
MSRRDRLIRELAQGRSKTKTKRLCQLVSSQLLWYLHAKFETSWKIGIAPIVRYPLDLRNPVDPIQQGSAERWNVASISGFERQAASGRELCHDVLDIEEGCFGR